jgi:predicted RNA-binding protein with PIN domain
MAATVLVDARNVLRSVWPNIPEERLVELGRTWAEKNGRRAVLVFDGRAPGDLVGERELDEHCTLVGTGAESADDWLTRWAAEYADQGGDYWLVTSDRALREAAGTGAARTVGGGRFARRLLSELEA